MSARLARILTLTALAPFLSGAHCNEDCGPPRSRVVARPMEKTIYGPAVLTIRPRVGLLADGLGPFEKRGLRVDVSRAVVVLLTNASSAATLDRLDAAKLAAGDRSEAFQVLAVVEQVGNVALFTDPSALAEAKRAGWDAVVLLPRERSRAPWEASVTVEMGHLVASTNDPESGRCVERPGASAPPLEWRLGSLPLRCGDGVRQEDEDCDDGNREGGDGCSPYCTKER